MNAEKVLNPDFAEGASSKLARQQIIGAGKTLEIDGTDVYKVPQGWECEQLKQDPNVVQVTTTVELETALQNPDQATIFIPKQSALNAESIEAVASRCSLDKTIFWEA